MIRSDPTLPPPSPDTLLDPRERADTRRFIGTAAVALLGLGAAWCGALRDGFHEPIVPHFLLVALQLLQLMGAAAALSFLNPAYRRDGTRGIIAVWASSLLLRRTQSKSTQVHPPTGFDGFIYLVLPVTALAMWLLSMPRLSLVCLDGASLLAALIAIARLGLALLRRFNAPGLLLPATFVLLIVCGTALLMLPRCSTGATTSWIDALFTATSATCVTGLTVRSTAGDFTPAGQAVIALLIQLGGLGIVVFGATFAALLRGSLSLKEHVTMRDLLEHQSVSDLRRFALTVVGITLFLELIGALLLLPFWASPSGGTMAFRERLGMSAFHAISAFCNAGFDITGDSLQSYRASPLSWAVIGPLIILGGIGFPVLQDLARAARGRRSRTSASPGSRHRLSLHSRLTLLTTACLLVGGAIILLLSQAGAGEPSLPTRSADAWFMSLSARTAGFNTIPMDELTPASRLTLIALMFVGGSPGSMAGGLKTTTLALLVLAVLATIRGRAETESAGRAIPETLIRKAGAIAICMLALVLFSTLALCLVEREADPFVLLFEAVSAATTTGLSLGITAQLSDPGKLIITLTMFLGRVGPLTLLGVLMIRRPPARSYLFPREGVTLG
jgi:trk system potassium uptake protein TrkH